jgi:hypothetical protein
MIRRAGEDRCFVRQAQGIDPLDTFAHALPAAFSTDIDRIYDERAGHPSLTRNQQSLGAYHV